MTGSQLLDLLLDVNESNRVPLRLRYDLRSPTPDAAAVPGLEPDRSPLGAHDINNAQAALEEARSKLATGQLTPSTYRELEAELLEAISKPNRTLAHLNNTPHTTLLSVTPNDLPSDLDEVKPTGYLSPNHEHDYLLALDNSLDNTPLDSHSLLPSRLAKRQEKEKEKDAQLRNPVSVHNWLRKHHPSVFLQDEPNTDKVPTKHPAKTSPKPPKEPRSTKRSSAAPKHEHEVIDEEGFVIGGNLEVPSRSKRKREDEPYRPKGGSSRSTKRKKVSAGAMTKKISGEDEGS